MPASAVHRLSYADVMQMVEAGVLGNEDRVELLDGVLVDMSPIGPSHSAVVARLNRHFVAGIAGTNDLEVRVQDLLVVDGGYLLPDLMVVDPTPFDRHPATAHLVIEVSVTTQRHDTWKAGKYAPAGVGEYWIVDVPARVVRVHREPGAAGYADVAEHGDRDEVSTSTGAPSVVVGELLAPGPPA